MERMCSHAYHSSRHLVETMLFMFLMGIIVGVGIGIGVS